MIYILWSCEYRYQIMKLFTTCSEIGWKLKTKLVVFIMNLIHDSNEIDEIEFAHLWIEIILPKECAMENSLTSMLRTHWGSWRLLSQNPACLHCNMLPNEHWKGGFNDIPTSLQVQHWSTLHVYSPRTCTHFKLLQMNSSKRFETWDARSHPFPNIEVGSPSSVWEVTHSLGCFTSLNCCEPWLITIR